MSTDMEEYLKNYRDRLDVEQPEDDLIWEGIRKDISGDRSVKKHSGRRLILTRVRNVAAVVIFAMLTGYVINDLMGDRMLNRTLSLASIDRGLGQREKEYQEMVSYRMEEVNSYTDVSNAIINELLEEINRLDTIYDIAMNDLEEMGLDEQVVNTIFDTYEKKIKLLELIILETNKEEYNETEESVIL